MPHWVSFNPSTHDYRVGRLAPVDYGVAVLQTRLRMAKLTGLR